MAEYINKEVLIQTLKDNTTEMESDIYYGSNMGIPENEVENIVNEVPSADVVEVKHGYWRKEELLGCEPYYLCSICGKLHHQEYSYCGNCGAKMDGKEEKEMVGENIKNMSCARMTRSELIELVPNKPYRMPCCRECMGKSKKDCDENPLNCFDFYLLNKETIYKLREKELNGGAK